MEWTQCLALEVDTSFASRRMTRVLETSIAERGNPQVIRCDNGPELTSRHFLACVSSARSNWYTSNQDEKIIAWQKEYKQERPHSSLRFCRKLTLKACQELGGRSERGAYMDPSR